jgi:hypothetical protein
MAWAIADPGLTVVGIARALFDRAHPDDLALQLINLALGPVVASLQVGQQP